MRSYRIPCVLVRVIADIYDAFECAAIDGSETSEWFKIESGVSRDAYLTDYGLDYDKTGARCWNFASMLEDLDFAATSPCCHLSLMTCTTRLGD